METVLLIYLIGVLPNLVDLLFTVGGFGLVFSGMVRLFEYTENTDIEVKKDKIAFFGLMMIVFACLIPNEKYIWMMAGGYIAQEAFTSEIGQDVIYIVNEKIKEYKTEVIEQSK